MPVVWKLNEKNVIYRAEVKTENRKTENPFESKRDRKNFKRLI